MSPDSCHLHAALGRSEECPRTKCAFWDRRALGRECVIEGLRLNVAADPALAAYLLDVRRDIEAAPATSACEQLLPPGLAAD